MLWSDYFSETVPELQCTGFQRTWNWDCDFFDVIRFFACVLPAQTGIQAGPIDIAFRAR